MIDRILGKVIILIKINLRRLNKALFFPIKRLNFIFIKIISVQAVSYTHLDVYKRQMHS